MVLVRLNSYKSNVCLSVSQIHHTMTSSGIAEEKRIQNHSHWSSNDFC